MGHESVHSPLSHAEFQNEWSPISSPPHAFIACKGATFPSLRHEHLMTVYVRVNDKKCTQRLICVVVDDLLIMRFKTEHLPTQWKASEGKDH